MDDINRKVQFITLDINLKRIKNVHIKNKKWVVKKFAKGINDMTIFIKHITAKQSKSGEIEQEVLTQFTENKILKDHELFNILKEI